MRVLVFGIHQGALVQAVKEGVERLGHRVILRAQGAYRENGYETCDAAVIFGLHRPGDLILKEFNAQGVPVYIVDYGYVKRGTLMYSKVDEDKYYSVSLNGLNGHSHAFPSPMSGDRWEALGVPLVPWRTDGKYIVVCGQKQNDVAIGNLNSIFWAKQIIGEIGKYTNRPIVFRGHPEDPNQKRPIGVPHDEHANFQDTLKDAYAVVAYNSNALVEATIAGVPTFTVAKGSMVDGVTNTNIALIESPELPDRTQWAADLAWRQYRIEEFRSGLFWEYAVEKKIPPFELPQPAIDFRSDDLPQGEFSSDTTEDISTPEQFFQEYVSSVSDNPIVRRGRPKKPQVIQEG